MSSGCGDVLSLADLQTAKKHQIFEAEVITGKSGGVAGGTDIDYATNQVTGQTQKTLPAVLRDAGFSPVSWDFSTGGALTAADRDKVVYDPVSKTWYSYAGTLPVTVPAGFNPVGNADWKPQTDPDLREELASTSGSALVGHSSGLTIAEELDHIKTATPVTPEMFMTGLETDHTSAWKAALAEAKARGSSFLANGDYVLTASSSDPISIEVPADMSGATVTCSTYQSGDVWTLDTTLFHIPQSATDVSSMFSAVSYMKGQVYFPVTGLRGSLVLESTDVVMTRESGSSQLKAEVHEIDPDGYLRYRNYYTYTAAPTVAYKPFLNNLTVKMPLVVLDGARINNILLCERNNTIVKGNTVTISNNGSARQFVNFQKCSRVKVRKLYSSPVGYLEGTAPSAPAGRNEAAYFILAEKCSDVVAEDSCNINGWGGFDGNYSRNVHINRCDLAGVGGHFSMSDIYVTESTIRYHCTAQGWGEWVATDCKHLGLYGKTILEFFSVKRDYMSSWDGEVRIEGLRVVPPSTCTGYFVVSSIEPKYNGGFIATSPDVVIRDVSLDLSYASGLTELRILDLGISPGSNYEQYMILPNSHYIENVKVVGTRSYGSSLAASVVYNQRNYTSLTPTQLSTIVGRGKYKLTVKDVDLARLGNSNSVSNPRYNVQTFKFTTYGVPQDISVINSYNCVPFVGAWNDMTIRVNDQDMAMGYIDAAVSRTSASYNRIFFNNCRIYGLGWSSSGGNRTGIFDFTGCVFGWISTITGVTETSSTTIGLLFGEYESGNSATGKYSGCAIPVQTNPYQIADSTFRTRIQANYVNGGVYQV